MEEIKGDEPNPVSEVATIPVQEVKAEVAVKDSVESVALEEQVESEGQSVVAESERQNERPNENETGDVPQHQAPVVKVAEDSRTEDNRSEPVADSAELVVASASEAERGTRQESPASEKYESAEEDPVAVPVELGKESVVSNMDVDPSSPQHPPQQESGDGTAETQESAMQVDENSNSSAHLQDIEMTNVDENRAKNEDAPEDDNNRSTDQLNVQDPFDQVKQTSNDGDGPETRVNETDDPHPRAGGEINQEQSRADEPAECNTETPGTDGSEETGNKATTADTGTAPDASIGEGTETNAEQQQAVDSTTEGEPTEKEDEQQQQQPEVAATELPAASVSAEQALEEESNATVDDLTGGENENVCLLPDDERPISEEDKERAIAVEEAEKEAERQETEAREHAKRHEDEISRVETAATGTDQEGAASGEKEVTVVGDRAEKDAQPVQDTGTVEVQDDDEEEPSVETETEVDGSATTAPSEDPAPSRDNQIRELPSPAASETCAQCKKEAIPCVYTMRRDGLVATDSLQYICSFECVQSVRLEFPGKFELVQQRVIIDPILGTPETCTRCGVKTACKFRYRLEDKAYRYICDTKCVENFTAINSEKYSLSKKRYTIAEKEPPLGENKQCVQCGDTKTCTYAFMQDEDELHVCSDCLNLFLTENPDLFRVNRPRTVRVRNLPQTSTRAATSVGSGGEVVKFTARSDEDAEAARLDRESSFQRSCIVCHTSLLLNSEQWLQWETMDFCGIQCLRKHQHRIGEVCIYCKGGVSVQSLGKYCVRFGFFVCQFCSAACLDSYKKQLINCSFCQKDVVSSSKRYVARVGEQGVFKDFCSQLCHKRYQSALNPALKQKRHVCAVCNNEKLSKIIVHLEGREHYFCGTPCFSAFKFVNNVNPDECGMCRDYFERKSAEAYTIFSQTGATEEGVPFCTKMCLNLYIISHRQIVACHWCKVKKYNFDMIQRAAGKVMLCSLHCLALAEASVAAKTMQELRCDHCLFVRTPQYHLTMSDASLRNFCTYQCVMSFQSQFNKPPLTVPSAERQKAMMETSNSSSSTTPVPTGLPRRIRKLPGATAASTATGTAVSGTINAISATAATSPVNSVKLSLPPTPAPIQPSTPSSGIMRTRERSTRSSATATVASGTANNGSPIAGTNFPVISSVESLAGRSRSKGAAVGLPQGKWPELRVTLEPLMNIPASGTIPLSSILPPALAAPSTSSISSGNIAMHRELSVDSAPPSPAAPAADSPIQSPSPPPTPVSAPTPPPPAPVAPPPAPPKIETRTQIVTVPPTPVPVANASTMCKPIQVTRSVSCRPIQCNVECQTEPWLQRKLVIPIPVPIYVPVPMFMYSMPTPVPVPIPLPIPVPVFIPTTRNSAPGIMKEIKKIQDKMPSDPYEAELLMMAEMVAGEQKKEESDSDSDDAAGGDDHFAADGGSSGGHELEHNTSFSEDLVQIALKMASNEYEEPHVDLESAMQANTISQQQQEQHGYGDLQQQQHHHHHQQQQLLILEQQRHQDSPVHITRGRKRTIAASAAQRNAATNNNTQQQLTAPATKRIKREQLSEPSSEPVRVVEPVEKPDANLCLKYTFGVNAWKQWVLTKNADLEKINIRRKPFKSDILQLTADELNYSLCLFVKEVRKPNGTEYAPDTIYYLVLGIQQYLFENARVENIFTDPYYERFTDCLDEVAKKFSVLYNDSQFIVTRVEEEHLWECKQLGAHSPHVLLSTLMFFNTKHFNLVSVEEHMELSFSHIMKHWKRNPHQGPKSAASRNVLLRFYPPQSSLAANARKKKVYEQQENEENPLRCPVKLYEFYLSKCPESVKTRNDVFYLQPERSCVPDSPVWYSTQPLSKESLSKMLHRVKMVKEINIALLTS